MKIIFTISAIVLTISSIAQPAPGRYNKSNERFSYGFKFHTYLNINLDKTFRYTKIDKSNLEYHSFFVEGNWEISNDTLILIDRINIEISVNDCWTGRIKENKSVKRSYYLIKPLVNTLQFIKATSTDDFFVSSNSWGDFKYYK